MGLPYALGARPSTLGSHLFQSAQDLCERTFRMNEGLSMQGSYFTCGPSHPILTYSDQKTT